MSEKTSSKNKKEQKKSRVGIVLRIAVLVLLSIALLGVIGVLGNTLRGFFLGVFGFSAYAILPVAIVLYVLFGFGLIRKKPRVRTILFTIGLVLLLALYLQIFTSSEIDLSSFSLYVRGCYSAALGTSGGWLIGLIAYPLLSLMGKYSMILVAVLFFVVLFFALFPMMRGAKPKASPERAQTESRPVSPMESVPRKSGVKLFVDKVRPGQKDAQKIKMKGGLQKKVPNRRSSIIVTRDRSMRPKGLSPKSRRSASIVMRRDGRNRSRLEGRLMTRRSIARRNRRSSIARIPSRLTIGKMVFLEMICPHLSGAMPESARKPSAACTGMILFP